MTDKEREKGQLLLQNASIYLSNHYPSACKVESQFSTNAHKPEYAIRKAIKLLIACDDLLEYTR